MVDERLRELDTAADVEHVDAVEILASQRPRQDGQQRQGGSLRLGLVVAQRPLRFLGTISLSMSAWPLRQQRPAAPR